MDIKEKISNITVWKCGGIRAPHKPLLILLMLSNILHDESRYIFFAEIEDEFEALLKHYGPPRKAHHPNYPFWRLIKDGIWKLTPEEPLKPYLDQSKKDPGKRLLRKHEVKGGFTDEIHKQLVQNRDLIYELTELILEDNFPRSLHNDICESLGLEIEYSTTKKKKRDPEFRQIILDRYDYKCAVCGYSIWLMGKPVGLEAAHIKWHQIGGPDTINNGIALCSLHHKLFDYGAFTLDDDYKINVSHLVTGKEGMEKWLYNHIDKPISLPDKQDYYPDHSFRKWHIKEVFKRYKV